MSSSDRTRMRDLRLAFASLLLLCSLPSSAITKCVLIIVDSVLIFAIKSADVPAGAAANAPGPPLLSHAWQCAAVEKDNRISSLGSLWNKAPPPHQICDSHSLGPCRGGRSALGGAREAGQCLLVPPGCTNFLTWKCLIKKLIQIESPSDLASRAT